MTTYCPTCDTYDSGRTAPDGVSYCEECLDVEGIEYIEDDDDETDDPIPPPFGGYDEEVAPC